MRYNIYLTRELRIVGAIAILPFVTLMSIIAVMWIHIKIQDEVILNLKMEVSELECYKEIDKALIRRMCLHELFEGIDYSEKTRTSIRQVP